MEISPVVNRFDQFMREVMETLNIVPRVVDAYKDNLFDCQNRMVNTNRMIEDSYILFEMLKDVKSEITKLHNQMKIVRRFMDEEKYRRNLEERDRDYYKSKVEQMIMMFNNGDRIKFSANSETNLKQYCHNISKFGDKSNNIVDLQSTGSIMADLSYTRDENDFDFSFHENRSRRETSNLVKKKKRRSSSATRFCELASKDKMKVEYLSTVTIDEELIGTVKKHSSVNARAVLQNNNTDARVASHTTIAPEESKTPIATELNIQFMTVNTINSRSHNFQQKTMLKGGTCNVCFKRLRFSTLGYKCRDCKATCHEFCKDNAPLPCLFNGSTPGKLSNGLISDYTPPFSPMIPSLVVHCIKEIESRGMEREGLYLVPGSDADIKSLKSTFLRGKGVPDLSQIQEIDVICGFLKDFFKSLKDPLTTRAKWEAFTLAVEIPCVQKMKKVLYQIISELAQPNRDTLAYLVLHLKNVVESPGCKMTVSLLANVFGPIIIGYSCHEPANFYGETRIVNKVMVELIELPKKYWEGLFYQTDPTVVYSPIATRRFRRNYFETP